MEIHVHVNSGETFKFQQSDPLAAEAILTSIQPQKVFSLPQIIMQGNTSTSGFHTATVEYVEFIGGKDPEWGVTPGVEFMHMVTKEEYSRRLSEIRGKLAQMRHESKAGDRVEAQGEFVLKSGRRLYLCYAFTRRSRIDSRQFILSFMETKVFTAKSENGVVLINPANIVRWIVYPGPPDAPQTAWHASRIG